MINGDSNKDALLHRMFRPFATILRQLSERFPTGLRANKQTPKGRIKVEHRDWPCEAHQ